MLKQLSKLERTRNIVIIGFAVLMAVSLVIFYAPGRNSANGSPAASNEVLAKVNGEEITVGDLQQLKDNYMQMFGGQINLAQLGGDQRFLDGLIRDRIISQEAVRLGLSASDAEVAAKIRGQFKDASGKVDVERYKERVQARYGDVTRFEKQMRDTIAQEKLNAFITAGVSVSPEEVQEDYVRQNTSFDLVYVPVAADKLAQKIQVSDADLHAYYDQHKTDYRILEAQKKIRYLYIEQAKVGEKLQIPDTELRAEYDRLTPEQKQGGTKVQQIILKVARPDLDESVKNKAYDLVKKARDGENGLASEKNFAELAKGNSEDPATAQNGGWLSGVVKKNPNKPDDPYQKALEIQESTVLDPVKYGNAYYVLRKGEPVAKTFEEAKPELLVSLRNRKAYSVAAQLAQKAHDAVKESKGDFQKAAQQVAAEANMKPAEMIKETAYVTPGEDVKDIGSSPQFEEAIAPLNNPNDIGERTPIKGGFAIPMLVDKKEPRVPDYDEVKGKVEQAIKIERAKSQLEAKAKELAGSASGAGDLKAAAEKLGLEARTADAYKLSTPLGEAGTSPAADDAIFALKQGEVSKTPIKIGDNWVVVGATKRTEADLAEFAKQRDEMTKTAISSRRTQVFNDYIAAVQARLQREGKIKIYKDVFDSLADEDVPTAAPPPRMP
ncbi:MAG: SurA N-terminal domain-containing protein, partial [Pyrinomonadaceae bacterium]